MKTDNLFKYIYFLILMILIVGYFLISGQYLKFKYSRLFYIRISILSYLFYVLSDNLLYTLIFSAFISIAVSIHHRNSLIENFKENETKKTNVKKKKTNVKKKNTKIKNKDKEDNKEDFEIDLYNNKQIIKGFYEYGDNLIKNEKFINNNMPQNKSERNRNLKMNRINTNLEKITKLIDKY